MLPPDANWKKQDAFYSFCRMLSRVAFRLYFRVRIFGLQHVPSSGGVLLAANHQSFLDPIAAGIAIDRQCHFIARDTLFTNPLFGRLIRAVNAFPVKRGEADINAVKEMLRRLRDGHPVVIFPEATRSRDGTISTINANSLAIAKRAGVPIVPTLIEGAFEAFPRGASFPRPRRIHVAYMPALTREQVAEWPVEKIVEVVTERLHQGMADSKALRTHRP